LVNLTSVKVIAFRTKVIGELDGRKVTWEASSEEVKRVEREALGVTSGKPPQVAIDTW
jgi:hypothetical protein